MTDEDAELLALLDADAADERRYRLLAATHDEDEGRVIEKAWMPDRIGPIDASRGR